MHRTPPCSAGMHDVAESDPLGLNDHRLLIGQPHHPAARGTQREVAVGLGGSHGNPAQRPNQPRTVTVLTRT